LAPPFLASIGAVGYVGYAFAQTKAVPSSSNVSFLHLLGVAGKKYFTFFSFTYISFKSILGGFGISFWITAVHGKILNIYIYIFNC
jgi:hypothetical protein